MPLFRSTVWVLSGIANAVDGDAGWHRYITERREKSVDMFKASVMDDYLSDLDAEIEFGPVSEVDEEKRELKRRGLKRGFTS